MSRAVRAPENEDASSALPTTDVAPATTLSADSGRQHADVVTALDQRPRQPLSDVTSAPGNEYIHFGSFRL